MMRGTIKLLNTYHDESPLRTQSATGWFMYPPKVGQRFRFYAKPLQEGYDVRMIDTSEVVDIQVGKGVLTILTRNSTYELELDMSDVEVPNAC